MSRSLFTLSTLALLALAIPGSAPAQEAAPDAPETAPAEAPSQGGGIAGELDMGNEAQDDPTYIKSVYEDWELKCFRSEAEQDPCQMYQLLYEESGNPVAEFSIFRLPGQRQATAGATIVVPLGTLLSEDLEISVDGGRAKSYSYRFCNLVGCYAQIGLTQADVDAMRGGIEATLKIIPAQAPDQEVMIPVSLQGFTAAFEETTVLDR